MRYFVVGAARSIVQGPFWVSVLAAAPAPRPSRTSMGNNLRIAAPTLARTPVWVCIAFPLVLVRRNRARGWETVAPPMERLEPTIASWDRIAGNPCCAGRQAGVE